MTEIKRVDESISVAGQVYPEQLDEIAALGFRSLICNRPDDEEPGQPSWAEIAQAAEKAGLAHRHIPIGGAVTPEDQAQAFAEALDELPEPVLAFCRTGNRSLQVTLAAHQTD